MGLPLPFPKKNELNALSVGVSPPPTPDIDGRENIFITLKEEYKTLGACTAYCHELKKESSDDEQEENYEFTRLCQVLKNAHKTFPDTLSEKGEQRITQLLHPLSQEVLSLLNEKVQQAIAEEHSYSTLLQEVSQMIVERME